MKNYEAPIMNIDKFATENVITTSGVTNMNAAKNAVSAYGVKNVNEESLFTFSLN